MGRIVMSLRSDAATTRDTSHALRIFVLEVALAGLGCAAPQLALAQDVPAFAPGMINHMQQMKRFKDVDHGQQPTPPVIPRFSVDPDPTGAVGTFQPNGATFTVKMRSSRISGPMAEPASAATSRKMAGLSVQPTSPSALRRVAGQTRSSGWSTAPRVRAMTSRTLPPNSVLTNC